MKLGKKGKLAAYLAVWALAGTILLSIPTLVSPIVENTLSPNTNTNGLVTPSARTNDTITYRIELGGSNGTTGQAPVLSTQFGSNQTLVIRTASATNVTISTYNGYDKVLTITSTAPANVTVTSSAANARASPANAISANLPDFVLRLSLILVPAIVLSSLGMVRTRRRVRTYLLSDAD